MKKPALVLILLCLLITPKAANANSQRNLGEIQQIQIVIEELDKDALDLGLTKESLSDQVLVALKRDLPKLKVVGFAHNALYVNITAIQDRTNTAVSLSVEVLRSAEIEGDIGSKISSTVTVWEKVSLLTGPAYNIASRVKDKISECITMFAAQYYKDNP